MKKRLTILLLFSSLVLSAQEKAFLLEGRIVDQLMQPVTDVYVVNLSNHNKDISRVNGVFSIWVTPSDSLIFSHISYYRKVVKVYSLLLNPMVMLESENINIPEIRISSAELTDMDRSEENMNFLNSYKPLKLERLAVENNPVYNIMTENNDLMRSDASSVHIVSFSPSQTFSQLFFKFKRKSLLDDYFSTRKVVNPPVEVNKEEETEKKEK